MKCFLHANKHACIFRIERYLDTALNSGRTLKRQANSHKNSNCEAFKNMLYSSIVVMSTLPWCIEIFDIEIFVQGNNIIQCNSKVVIYAATFSYLNKIFEMYTIYL